MMDHLPPIAFDPLISLPIIGLLSAVAILMSLSALRSHISSCVLRLLATGFIILALLNPQIVDENKDPLNDEVLILTDRSESTQLGGRAERLQAIETALVQKLSQLDQLEITREAIPQSEDGTRLISKLVESLGSLPQSRLAGVIVITDGQIHDIPDNVDAVLPAGVPLHAFVLEDNTNRDRRIRAKLAPQYGLVGEQADYVIQVDDPGHEGEQTIIAIRLNGTLIARFPVVIGEEVTLPVTIERRGNNTVELTVTAVENELTLKNNVFVSEISGIRDRMRVLLVTGAPHRGGRAWRNLLKSDPSVDLVQFTILTNPGTKNPQAGPNELSLIAFPTRQLFEEKLDEFDLIIFDQFARRSSPGRSGRSRPILPPYYIQNIADYVENGGALLIATGPAFAKEQSLYRSPLASILPARPTGDITTFAYRPELTDKGRRHPVTRSFDPTAQTQWGPWYRIIDSDVISGHVLMQGPGSEPLLILERIGDGRIGMLLSDQAWLWARGYQGGGPYSELFRRVSHWLLGEPDLDAEKLKAIAQGDDILIDRLSLSDNPQTVTVKKPDGTTETVTLERIADGHYQGRSKAAGQGAYRLKSGDVSTITAIGTLNPKEYADLAPTLAHISPLSETTNGLVAYVNSETDIPDIRRIKPTQTPSGAGWAGLVAHNDYVTRSSLRKPLAPGLLYFLFAIGCLGWAWRVDGK